MKLNRILLSSSILLNTLFSNAQTNIQENQSKISIGLTQSIDLGYRFSSANSASIWMKNISDSIEKPTLANSSAVKFQFDLNKKITLRTGIVFAQKGYQYKSGSLAGFDLYKEHFSFIEVPVKVLYKFGQKKNIPYISLGISAGYLVKSQAFYTLENSTNEVKMDLTTEDITINNEEKYNFKNQLFAKINPPFNLVKLIVGLLINYPFEDIYYEFTKKIINEKRVLEKIEPYIEELKKYYLKCKHIKYLENIDDKKFITILRQILRPYNYSIKAYEKYNNGEKYLLYVIMKNKEENKLKKINSIISFD